MLIEGSALELSLLRRELRLSLKDKKGATLLTAAAPWEPHFVDGAETYTLIMIWPGVRALYRELTGAYDRSSAALWRRRAASSCGAWGAVIWPSIPGSPC